MANDRAEDTAVGSSASAPFNPSDYQQGQPRSASRSAGQDADYIQISNPFPAGNAERTQPILLAAASGESARGSERAAVQPMSPAEIMAKNPRAANNINELIEADNGVTAPEVASQMRAGLGAMAARHGVDRVGQVLEGLREMGNGLTIHRLDFTMRSGDSAKAQQERAERLQAIDRLCQPGQLERVQDLHKTLQREGMKGSLGLREMTPANIDLLSKSPHERQAYIEFRDLARKSQMPVNFLGQHPEYAYDRRPTEVMQAYRAWSAQKR